MDWNLLSGLIFPIIGLAVMLLDKPIKRLTKDVK